MLTIVVGEEYRPGLGLELDALVEAAQARWHRFNAPHLAALVRAGPTFVDGVKVEREDTRDVA